MFFFDSNEIIRRLKQYPVLSHFSEFTLRRLVGRLETVYLEANQVLVHDGDPCDCVYYVVDGYLEGFSSDNSTKRMLNFRPGEIIGDVPIFAEEPHNLMIKSIRESQLLKIEKEVFLKFFQKNSDLLMVLTKVLAKNFRQVLGGFGEMRYPYKNIGLIVMYPDISIEKIKAIFQKQALKDNIHIYDEETFKAAQMGVVTFLQQCDDNLGINLFFSVNGDDEWNKAILDHVDYVYLITKEGTWEMLDMNVLANLRQRPCDIVIMHIQYGDYKDTAQFYARYSFKRHHHLVDSTADYQRLYRYMTGQTIGLVISGGGFRGFAHYGLIKALFEAKIPIDCIGGSSMGAGIGALLAINFNWKYFDELFNKIMTRLKNTKKWQHITLPLMSILSGEVATQTMIEFFGNYRIEDLPINFFCVTGNLSKSQKEIKNQGQLWEWLRASMAVPGILPPFEKAGTIYVDGGVCSNLPVLDMREYLDEVGKIIALNIRIPPFNQENYHFPPVFGFWDVIAYKLGLSRKKYVVPSFLDVVMESSFINQDMYDRQGGEKADIMVAPDTSSLSFRDAKKSHSLSLMAYELAQEKFLENKAVYERWIIEEE